MKFEGQQSKAASPPTPTRAAEDKDPIPRGVISKILTFQGPEDAVLRTNLGNTSNTSKIASPKYLVTSPKQAPTSPSSQGEKDPFPKSIISKILTLDMPEERGNKYSATSPSHGSSNSWGGGYEPMPKNMISRILEGIKGCPVDGEGRFVKEECFERTNCPTVSDFCI